MKSERDWVPDATDLDWIESIASASGSARKACTPTGPFSALIGLLLLGLVEEAAALE